MPTGRRQFAQKPPRYSGHDRRTTRQRKTAPNGRKRGVRSTAIRRDDRPRDSTGLQPAIKTGQTPSRHYWRTPKAEGAGSWMGRPSQGSSRPNPVAPRLLKSQSRSGPSDGRVNPGSQTSPTLVKGGPVKPTGPKTGRPANRRGEQPSLLSQRVPETDLPGHVAAPRPSAPGQIHADDPGRALQERRAS